jgi:hypothetical protein
MILTAGLVRTSVAGDTEDYSKLLQALGSSKVSLADGIRQATRPPEAAISAKFEMEDGKLSLSVYTAEKGLGQDAEHNVLKELAASPETGEWKPQTEVFKDVPHVSRASEQLALMSLSRFSLLDIVEKAEKDQPGGRVFSITPTLHDYKAVFVVLVAADGKAVELNYDPMTGERLQTAK